MESSSYKQFCEAVTNHFNSSLKPAARDNVTYMTNKKTANKKSDGL